MHRTARSGIERDRFCIIQCDRDNAVAGKCGRFPQENNSLWHCTRLTECKSGPVYQSERALVRGHCAGNGEFKATVVRLLYGAFDVQLSAAAANGDDQILRKCLSLPGSLVERVINAGGSLLQKVLLTKAVAESKMESVRLLLDAKANLIEGNDIVLLVCDPVHEVAIVVLVVLLCVAWCERRAW